MSGGAGLLLTVVGFIVNGRWERWIFIAAGVVCLLVAAARAWHAAASKRDELIARAAPRLELFRDPSARPFHDVVHRGPDGEVIYLRVGVRNLGGTEIPRARLLLESCDPDDGRAVHRDHELQPMGRPYGTLDVVIPAHGEVIVDVAIERITTTANPHRDFVIRYAQPLSNSLANNSHTQYDLVLRAEGGGVPVRYRLNLGGTLTWRLDGLTQLPPTEVN